MTKDKDKEGPIFNPEGVRRLLEEGGGLDLDDDERALLVALVSADTESGRTLSEEERAVLAKLQGQVEDYDANELVRAVRHMVTSKPNESRKIQWPKIKWPRGRP